MIIPRVQLPEKAAKVKRHSKAIKDLHIDPALLEDFIQQSKNDVVSMDYEWFNYTLAQFWHVYGAWAGELIRSYIERSTIGMSFLVIETCTLGKVILIRAWAVTLFIWSVCRTLHREVCSAAPRVTRVLCMLRRISLAPIPLVPQSRIAVCCTALYVPVWPHLTCTQSYHLTRSR